MNAAMRERFDALADEVLDTLPEEIHKMLEEVPLVVEDHPAPEMCRELGICDRSALCGLYQGIPLSDRSVLLPWYLPDTVTIFREGIMTLSRILAGGRFDRRTLREQIRVTILHELAHYHGMDEEEIRSLGY
jgi:predicted Zn-dependent protease with MMP-like domain